MKETTTAPIAPPLAVNADDRGGWLNPDSVGWFADYAEVAFRAFGDRVPLWTTINEPWVVVDAGYLHGVNAPGHRNLFEAPIAMHHILLAHAAAVRAYRAGWKQRIGLVVNLEPKDAASERPEDVAAARRADVYNNCYHLDPVVFGRYPDGMPEVFGEGWPAFADGDVARIQEPIDFVGVNYYTRRVVRHDATALPPRAAPVPVPGAVTMKTGWEVHPDGLTRALVWVRERYGAVPIYVTENGAAFEDPATAIGGRVDDPLRVSYYRGHLQAVLDAIRAGVDVRGYFAWSLLDNYEWSSGYSLRFGLVHVDYATQKRTPKLSAEFYRELIARKCADILQPDINWVGGLTEARRIVAMASAYDLPVIPHGSSVFSYHLQYAFTNCPIAEFLVMSPAADQIVPLFGELFLNEPLPSDGYVELSDAPGWGVELNDKLELLRPFESKQREVVISKW